MKAISSLPWILLLSGGAPAQDVLVSSRFTDQVLAFDGATGAALGAFAEGGGLGNPVGATYGPEGDLYVVSVTSQEVLRYDGASGSFLDVFAQHASLGSGRHMVFGPDGDLYVAGGLTNAVHRFDGAAGTYLGPFTQGGPLSGPVGLAFGPSGDLFVASTLNHSLLRYDGQSGAYVGTIAAGGGLSLPQALRLGPDGLLYVTSYGNGAVRAYDEAGARDPVVFATGLGNPAGMGFTSDGRLLVADDSDESVVALDALDGTNLGVLVAPQAGGLDGPVHLLMERERRFELRVSSSPDPRLVVQVVGARPGTRLWLAAGRQPGSRPVGTCPGLELGMLDPRLVGVRVADPSGNAGFMLELAGAPSGATVRLQCLAPDACELTPVLVHTLP